MIYVSNSVFSALNSQKKNSKKGLSQIGYPSRAT